ncbi:hypothetical protein IFO70_02175 [Phormidium tenue FACHB-886]|nr:hypothetical protein [Phormidium tenue FACHB-886]
MRFSNVLRQPRAIGSILPHVILGSAVGVAGLWVKPAIAQALPACQPPRENQFLLLVVDPQANAQTQLQQLLPSNAILTACDYLSRSVVRVEGFSSAEIANAWAKYVGDRTGLQAFIARPAGAEAPAQPANSSSRPSATNTSSGNNRSGNNATGSTNPAAPTAYNPQPMGTGYAVLVNYANRPEVAAEVSETISRSVGLVSYNQRPYLLALQTTDQAAAAAILKTLNDRGFTAEIVDSRQVMLLTPTVAGTTDG